MARSGKSTQKTPGLIPGAWQPEKPLTEQQQSGAIEQLVGLIKMGAIALE